MNAPETTPAPLPALGFTGVGSLPGDDIDTALATAIDQSPDLAWLPELPGRGPGSDMIGRTLAAIAAASGEFGFDLQPSGWRLTARPGLDARRAVDRLATDIDALLPFADFDHWCKLQLAGPWTLAAAVELELLPDIAMPDFSSIALTRFKAEVADEAVDKALEQIAKANRVLEPVPAEALEARGHGAAAGEVLTVDFLGKIDSNLRRASRL